MGLRADRSLTGVGFSGHGAGPELPQATYSWPRCVARRGVIACLGLPSFSDVQQSGHPCRQYLALHADALARPVRSLAEAPAGRQADPLHHGRSQVDADTDPIAADALEVEEAFVDAGNLLPWRVPRRHGHHAAGHVSRQFEVRRQRDEACAALEAPHMESRCAIVIPGSFASLLRAMQAPSLLDSTITGRPTGNGPNTRSRLTFMLFTSTSADTGIASDRQ